jgi:hypothetical protein
MWKDEGEPVVNSLGDEVRPQQMEVPAWRTYAKRYYKKGTDRACYRTGS